METEKWPNAANSPLPSDFIAGEQNVVLGNSSFQRDILGTKDVKPIEPRHSNAPMSSAPHAPSILLPRSWEIVPRFQTSSKTVRTWAI